uniref:Uncharacterized protein n=1 Tax=Avena sativa TaxID=4498 RepID=A0ACD5ZSS7_AVESA
MAALQIAFAAISVAVVVVIAYFLHTCSREVTPIPPMQPRPGSAATTAATATGGDVELGAGMDEAAISALPRMVVVEGGSGGDASASCAVCLGDYDRGDVLRVLPACEHSFHRPCVDQWLRLRPSCPVCRTPPAPAAPSPAQASHD